MSRSCDETYDVYVEQPRTAAKAHVCDACHETITRGARYFSIHMVYDGDVETIKRCARCQAIHVHLRGLGDGDMWPDERLNCGEDYSEHWGVEPPPAIAALAFSDPNDCSALPLHRCRPSAWRPPDWVCYQWLLPAYSRHSGASCSRARNGAHDAQDDLALFACSVRENAANLDVVEGSGAARAK